jgi:CRISPR system Cascade subunit CasA
LQINAPSGGAGHRTSLRGGGPLTTLIVSDNDQQKILWQMLWLNVMPSFSENSEKNELSDIFPWLARTRTSDDKKEGIDTTPRDTSPLQMYWCMPRRIQLNFEKGGQGECHVCHRENISLLTDYITQNYGINYKGGWKHPLSPHY